LAVNRGVSRQPVFKFLIKRICHGASCGVAKVSQ
jgi:hypothetical protein